MEHRRIEDWSDQELEEELAYINNLSFNPPPTGGKGRKLITPNSSAADFIPGTGDKPMVKKKESWTDDLFE